ncbi:hypothetical protein V8E51_001492 [Hyaloscypha variabilis]
MCHTTHHNFLPCQHTLSSTSPCTPSTGFLLPTLLPTLLSPPKCTRTSTVLTSLDFCPACEAFWTEHGIGEEEARERVEGWRRRSGWKGSARPRWEGGVFVSFVGEGEVDEEGRKGEGDVEGEKRERERERRGSSSSTCTLWPGTSENVVGAEVLFSASAEEDGIRTSVVEEDGEKGGLDECAGVEEDRVENSVPQLLPGLTAKDGLVHPDVFELDGLEEDAASADDGFEWQELTMPPRPFPKEGLQRSGEGRKLC